MMKRRSNSNHLGFKQSMAGFTLLELLVVIVMIGIIFAISAPGWDALMSRQRVSTGREQVLQVLRQAQSEARTSRSPQVVVFDVNPANGVPRVAYRTGNALNDPLTSFNNWKSLGGNNIERGMLVMRTNNPNNRIVFDSNGTVALLAPSQLNTLPTGTPPNNQGFGITIARANTTGNGTNRCVIINTLLGATRLAEGADCP